MPEFAELVSTTNAWACYDCGKCTATCPIARAGASYSPRRHVLATNLRQRDQVLRDRDLFSCLTCSLCDRRCPAEVCYTDLVQKLRELTRGEGVEPECPHGGALQSAMRIMAEGGTKQQRLDWLEEDLRVEPHKGTVFFWTGCAMYYDAYFPDSTVQMLKGTRATIRLLNKLDIVPVVSADERCCGHDLLWNGDRATFEKLARHNLKLVEDSGADLLITSCAECLRTWKLDYPEYSAGRMPKMQHISEFIGEHLGELGFKSNGTIRVTYQDPCRLGRHLGVYDAPRQALEALPGVELVEMRHSGPAAACCAGGTWSNCDRFAKKMQVDRLREARATGAQQLVTACPKCQIHFHCAMQDPQLHEEIKIEMRDLVEIVVDALN